MPQNNFTTELSDQRIIDLAFNSYECAGAMQLMNRAVAEKSGKTLEIKNSESLIPDLLTVMQANPDKEFNGIAAAVKGSLNKPLDKFLKNNLLARSAVKATITVTETNGIPQYAEGIAEFIKEGELAGKEPKQEQKKGKKGEEDPYTRIANIINRPVGSILDTRVPPEIAKARNKYKKKDEDKRMDLPGAHRGAYEEVLKSMLEITKITCKYAKSAPGEISTTSEIKDLFESGRFAGEAAERLQTAMQVIEAQDLISSGKEIPERLQIAAKAIQSLKELKAEKVDVQKNQIQNIVQGLAADMKAEKPSEDANAGSTFKESSPIAQEIQEAHISEDISSTAEAKTNRVDNPPPIAEVTQDTRSGHFKLTSTGLIAEGEPSKEHSSAKSELDNLNHQLETTKESITSLIQRAQQVQRSKSTFYFRSSAKELAIRNSTKELAIINKELEGKMGEKQSLENNIADIKIKSATAIQKTFRGFTAKQQASKLREAAVAEKAQTMEQAPQKQKKQSMIKKMFNKLLKGLGLINQSQQSPITQDKKGLLAKVAEKINSIFTTSNKEEKGENEAETINYDSETTKIVNSKDLYCDLKSARASTVDTSPQMQNSNTDTVGENVGQTEQEHSSMTLN